MTELDRVDSRDNVNFRGVHYFYKSARGTCRHLEKRRNNCTDGSASYLSKNVGDFRKILGVRIISVSCERK